MSSRREWRKNRQTRKPCVSLSFRFPHMFNRVTLSARFAKRPILVLAERQTVFLGHLTGGMCGQVAVAR